MPTDDTDENDSTEPDQPTRRSVLATTGAAVLAPAALASDAAADTTDATIPAPFDAIPTLDEPSEFDRRVARSTFPPEAVPDEGPIPDLHYQHTVTREITVPAWGLAAARWRLQRRLNREADDTADTPADLPAWRVEEALMGYAQLREEFRTPDGRDAVDAVRESLEEGGHVE